MPKPKSEHLRFLDQVRETGAINMMGAAKPLREMYPELDKQEARDVHVYWMQNYDKGLW